MPTYEDYRQMANRSAHLAIACSAPSVAHALLALGLEYMALAARLSQPAEMHQSPPASVSRQKCSKSPPVSEIRVRTH